MQEGIEFYDHVEDDFCPSCGDPYCMGECEDDEILEDEDSL